MPTGTLLGAWQQRLKAAPSSTSTAPPASTLLGAEAEVQNPQNSYLQAVDKVFRKVGGQLKIENLDNYMPREAFAILLHPQEQPKATRGTRWGFSMLSKSPHTFKITVFTTISPAPGLFPLLQGPQIPIYAYYCSYPYSTQIKRCPRNHIVIKMQYHNKITEHKKI